MPTLRERPEDIILLANSFLREFAEENGRPVKPLTDEAIHRLVTYPWPGNVRELRTAIEHGVVMSNDAVIGISHLPAFLGEAPKASEPARKSVPGEPDVFNLEELEKGVIRRALAETGDNRTRAAELLGISRRTLQRKIKELGL
jgi:DNA-binding NtrC family response regulator